MAETLARIGTNGGTVAGFALLVMMIFIREIQTK